METDRSPGRCPNGIGQNEREQCGQTSGITAELLTYLRSHVPGKPESLLFRFIENGGKNLLNDLSQLEYLKGTYIYSPFGFLSFYVTFHPA